MSDFNELISDMDMEVINTFSEKVLIDDQLVDAVFDSPHITAFDVDHEQPFLTILEGAYKWVSAGMKVVVRGQKYIISSIEPDQTGMVLLRLEKQ